MRQKLLCVILSIVCSLSLISCGASSDEGLSVFNFIAEDSATNQYWVDCLPILATGITYSDVLDVTSECCDTEYFGSLFSEAYQEYSDSTDDRIRFRNNEEENELMYVICLKHAWVGSQIVDNVNFNFDDVETSCCCGIGFMMSEDQMDLLLGDLQEFFEVKGDLQAEDDYTVTIDFDKCDLKLTNRAKYGEDETRISATLSVK